MNNAVARAAGLLSVVVVPGLAGISGADYTDPAAFDAGFRSAVVACAVLLALGGLLSWATIRQTGVARVAPGDTATPVTARRSQGTSRGWPTRLA